VTHELFSMINSASITLPAIHLTILLVVLTVCLVLRLTRTGLITAYLFIYWWGWTLFAGKGQNFFMGYLVFGMIVGIITIIGLVLSHHAAE
jgi:hypothetical protein